MNGERTPLTSAFSQLLGNIFPVGGWRIYTISGSMPIFDPKTWRLEIGGLVAKPRSFTYDELRKPRRDRREDPARRQRPRKRRQPAREERQKRAAAIGTRIGVRSAHGPPV